MPEVNLQKAIQIVETHKAILSLIHVPDLIEALTTGLVCMSYCDAMIKALGEAEIAKLTKED